MKKFQFAGSSLVAFVVGCGGAQGGAGGPGPGGGDGAIVINRQTILDHIEVQTPPLEATAGLTRLIGSEAALQTACGTKTTEDPIAIIRIEEPVPLLELQMANHTHTFVVIGDGKRWEACDTARLEVADGEWGPGEYAVYPAHTNPLPISYQLVVRSTDPGILAAAEAKRARDFQAKGVSGAVIVNAETVARGVIVPPAQGTLTERIENLLTDRTITGSASCLYKNVTPQPLAVLQVADGLDELRVTVSGRESDYQHLGGKDAFALCNESRGGGGTLALAEPLAAGRWEIYGYGPKDTNVDTVMYVTSADPKLPMPAVVGPEVVIDGALATPRLVEVDLQSQRRRLPRDLDGYGCDAFLPGAPDITVAVTTPPKNQRFIVLPTIEPIVLATGRAGQRRCSAGGFGLARDQGTYALSLGSASSAAQRVTLMFVDETTVLDPTALHAFGDDTLPVGRRSLLNFFPQAELGTIGAATERWDGLDVADRLFKAAPTHAFVYATADLEEEAYNTPRYIAKGEALLVYDMPRPDSTTLRVLTVDGMIATVFAASLSTQRPESITAPASPRPLSGRSLFSYLPPGDTTAKTYQAKIDARSACIQKAEAPYRAKLPTVAAGWQIVQKSPAYVRIETAMYAAADKKCKTDDDFKAKVLAPMEAKAQAVVAADRVARMAAVIAHLRK